QVRPDRPAVRVVCGLVQPRETVLGAAEAVRLFRRERRGDASVREGDPALRGLVLDALSVARGDELEPRDAFHHRVAGVRAGGSDQGDARGAVGHPPGVLGAGAGLPGAATAAQEPETPVPAGRRPLVTAGMRVRIPGVRFTVAGAASLA